MNNHIHIWEYGHLMNSFRCRVCAKSITEQEALDRLNELEKLAPVKPKSKSFNSPLYQQGESEVV